MNHARVRTVRALADSDAVTPQSPTAEDGSTEYTTQSTHSDEEEEDSTSKLTQLLSLLERIRQLQQSVKALQRQFKGTSSQVLLNMRDNHVQRHRMQHNGAQFNVSIVDSSRFPKMTPAFVLEVLDQYFNSTTQPTSTGATTAIFEARANTKQTTERLAVKRVPSTAHGVAPDSV